VIGVEGGDPRRLTTQGALRPRWSPDGADLVYLSSASGAQVQVWRVSVTSGATEQLTEGGYKAQAEYAPDGMALAYQGHDGVGFDIWVMPAGGGAATRLTTDADDDASPRWSPDGSRIAFLSDTTGNRLLHVMPAGGGEAIRLITADGSVGGFEWLPDGSALVYSFREGSVNLWTALLEQIATR
jgi:TolB protein